MNTANLLESLSMQKCIGVNRIQKRKKITYGTTLVKADFAAGDIGSTAKWQALATGPVFTQKLKMVLTEEQNLLSMRVKKESGFLSAHTGERLHDATTK